MLFMNRQREGKRMRSFTTVLMLILVGTLSLNGSSTSPAQKAAAQLYQQGMAAFYESNWDEAIRIFSDVVNKHGRSSWADDSDYWTCEVKLAQAPGSEEAFACFESFTKRHRESKYRNNAEAKMVTIGQQLIRQGNTGYEDKIRAISESQDDELRIVAIKALAEHKDQAALDAIMEMYDGSRNEKIRIRIADVLEDFENPQVTSFLIRIARQDSSVKVRSQAIRSLGDRPWDDSVVQFMKDLAESGEHIDIRRRAIMALGSLENPEMIPYLIELSSSSEEKIVTAAMEAIHDIGGAPALDAYKKIYQSSAGERARQRAVSELGDHGGAAVLPFLQTVALEGPDPKTQRVAVAAIGDVESPEALTVLGKIISQSKDPQIRRTAMAAMGDAGGEQAIPLLGEVLKSDPDAGVRRSAARALGDTENDGAIPYLKEAALNDPHVDVKRSAVAALGEIGTPAAKQALVEFLKRGSQ